MSVSQRIKQARTLKGMSQRAVAKRVGLSATAISKYERGKMKPGSGVLIQLSDALEVPLDYFLRPQRVRSIEPAYRKRASLGKKAERQITEQIRDWLERYLEAEAMATALPVSFDLPDSFPRVVHSLEEVEDAADDLRRGWEIGLDPIENMTLLLEDKGVKVGILLADDDFDACAFEADVDGGIPVVVFNENFSGDRQRLTLAHELGHLALRVSGELNEEAACQRFAGAFLAPRSTVRADFGGHRHAFNIRELRLLKHKYGMSMQALIYRAKDLGVLSEHRAGQMFKDFRRRGWYKAEPGDPIPSEEPQRFELIVLRLLTEDVISMQRAETLLGRPIEAEAAEGAVPA